MEKEKEYLQVAIPIFTNVTAFDFMGPYEVLHLLPNVKLRIIGHTKDNYMADMGMLSFHTTATFDEVPNPDIIVVPGGPGVNCLLADAPILEWIRKVKVVIIKLYFVHLNMYCFFEWIEM